MNSGNVPEMVKRPASARYVVVVLGRSGITVPVVKDHGEHLQWLRRERHEDTV